MQSVPTSAAPFIEKAARTLINGGLVAFPTETVYGLGADATNEGAISRVYAVKGRPIKHPLIVHISSIDHLSTWARDIPTYAIKLAEVFWPGPMTLILPRSEAARDFITGGQDNVGIRVPSHSVALELLKEFEMQGGLGVAAPSANRYGKVSPTTRRSVQIEIGKNLTISDLILEGGLSSIGLESTIIDCTQASPTILRPGAITRAMVRRSLNDEFDLKKTKLFKSAVRAPGMLKSHYSPNGKVFLSGDPMPGDGLIALSTVETPSGVERLASPKNNNEYAQQLYEALRLADEKHIENIFIVPPKGCGIAEAINDRLKKCSFKTSKLGSSN
jgi:L-threonylcarbamoyladenylate synthase